MNKDLTVGSPSKVLWQFCLPMFGSILFQQLYNIADSLVAGKLIGENALAAVGNSYEITLIFLAFSFGCNIGGSVIVSRYFGAKDYNTMKTAISTALIGTVVLCGALMAVGLLGCRSLLVLIRTPAELMVDSAEYLDIYTLGLPFLFLYNVATGIFTALGDSRTPFLFLAGSSTANIAVDVLFVAAFDLGVAGVAWATFLCQGVSCVLSLWVVARRVRAVPSEGERVWFSWKMLGQIAVVAIPSILQQSFVSVGNLFIQGLVNSFGSAVIAGYSSAIKLNTFSVTCMSTLANGLSSFTAQNIGAHKESRITDGLKESLRMGALVCLPFVVIYLFLGRFAIGLFLDNGSPNAIHAGMMFLRIVSPFYFVVMVKAMCDGVLRGTSSIAYFTTTTFTDLVLRVVLAYFFVKALSMDSTGIWLSWPVGWTLSAALSFWFYHIRPWQHHGPKPKRRMAAKS